MNMRLCCYCKKPTNRHRSAMYCLACLEKRGHGTAGSKVQWAIKHGLLPHPSTLQCVDCGEPAKCYDHRDYAKPLEVDPVCASCNYRRGQGAPA